MKTETAIIAAGCFWGVEELIRKIDGVLKTQVGYCGGQAENALYTKVKTGETNHAEAVKIIFDPDIINYQKLIELFFKLHDPTTMNQQGNDIGSQYRSAIFYFDNEQKQIAESVKLELQNSNKWPRPIVTIITAATEFFDAEDYHQDYLQKNPGGYTCHYWRK